MRKLIRIIITFFSNARVKRRVSSNDIAYENLNKTVDERVNHKVIEDIDLLLKGNRGSEQTNT